MKRKNVILGCVVVLALFPKCSELPTSTIEERFRTHRSEFEKLRDMMVEDDALFYVRADYYALISAPREELFRGGVALSESRWLEYRNQLNLVGAIEIIRPSIGEPGGPRDTFRFILHESRFFAPIAKGLIHTSRARKGGPGLTVSRLDDGWYAFELAE